MTDSNPSPDVAATDAAHQASAVAMAETRSANQNCKIKGVVVEAAEAVNKAEVALDYGRYGRSDEALVAHRMAAQAHAEAAKVHEEQAIDDTANGDPKSADTEMIAAIAHRWAADLHLAAAKLHLNWLR